MTFQLGLVGFIDEIRAEIYEYSKFHKTSKSDEVISEHILSNLSKWTTGITRTILVQDGVIKSKQILREDTFSLKDDTQVGTLHAEVSSIGLFEDSNAGIIIVNQIGHDKLIDVHLHGSALEFLQKLIVNGTKLHIANAFLINQQVIPTQNIVIELMRTKEHIDFIVNETKSNSLASLNQQTKALLLKVVGPSENGILMSDRTTEKAIELILDEIHSPVKTLLHVNDVLVVWKPWIVDFSLRFGLETLLFRVPVTGGEASERLTQSSLTQKQRDSSSSFSGSITSIQHFFNASSPMILTTGSFTTGSWTSTRITVTNSISDMYRVEIHADLCTYEQQKLLSKMRINHYIYGFGFSVMNGVYQFTNQSAIYDTSLLESVIQCSLIPTIPLVHSMFYQSFITKAVVLDMNVSVVSAHKLCNSVLSQTKYCSVCRSNVSEGIGRDLLMEMTLEDGTGSITGYAMASTYPLWSTNANEWSSLPNTERDKRINEIVGGEYMFMISKGLKTEIGGYDELKIWRIDDFCAPVGLCDRETARIIDHFFVR